MCGSSLLGKTESAAEAGALPRNGEAAENKPATTGEMAGTSADARQLALTSDPMIAKSHSEQGETQEAERVTQPQRSDKWWVDESDTTVGGPSFLGLSSSGTGSGGGYSYLFQDEEEKSHKAGWVFLAVLLVLGGVVYAKWQPIRDYVVTTAMAHSRPQKPASTDTSSAPPSASTSSAPTTTVASSDQQSPATQTDNKAEANNTSEQKTADQKEGLPEGDK